jgi:hypothetical protein
LGIREQLDLLNRHHTAALQARAESIKADPDAQAALEARQLEAHRDHNRKRPLRRQVKEGERFRYASRSEGARELRRRAQHAAQALPWHFRVNYELTNTEIIVLTLHYRKADEAGQWEPSITEIANRSAVSYRAVQLANRRLAALGLLYIEERPDMPFRHRTNIYRLGKDLLKARKGAKSFAPKGDSFSESSTNNVENEKIRGARVSDPPSLSPSQDESKSDPRWVWVAGFGLLHSNPTETELKIAQQANHMLDPDQPRSATKEALWIRGAELVEKHAPRIYGNLIASGVRNHGFKALLAIYEMALLSECNHVRSGHGYLWGVLRKLPDDCRPAMTLSRLFAARRVPGYLRAAGDRVEASIASLAGAKLRDNRSGNVAALLRPAH